MSTHPINQNISHTRKFLGNVTKYIKICCVIKPLQFLVARNCSHQKMAYMRSLPAKTVGHDLAHMLDSRGLKLIPGFAKHDLDHLILGYGMHPEEELCMQAYLIGNGRWQLQVFLFLSSAVLLPGLWGELWAHYKLGRQRPSLTLLTFDSCLTQNTEHLRRKYAPPSMLITKSATHLPSGIVG
ncbi:MAG: hypothetical protein KDB03_25160 [Planctomycetales bacterium]|nr:hypothetical protein [Planctomycetales bacterium]